MSNRTVSRGEALAASTQHATALRLAYSTGRSGVAALARVVSLARGYEIYYPRGVVPMNSARRILSGATALLTTRNAAVSAYALRERLRGRSSYTHFTQVSTLGLTINTVLQTATAAYSITEAVTGRSPLRKQSLSTFGRAVSTVDVVPNVVGVLAGGRELYRRRHQWIPGVRRTAHAAEQALARYGIRRPGARLRSPYLDQVEEMMRSISDEDTAALLCAMHEVDADTFDLYMQLAMLPDPQAEDTTSD